MYPARRDSSRQADPARSVPSMSKMWSLVLGTDRGRAAFGGLAHRRDVVGVVGLRHLAFAALLQFGEVPLLQQLAVAEDGHKLVLLRRDLVTFDGRVLAVGVLQRQPTFLRELHRVA